MKQEIKNIKELDFDSKNAYEVMASLSEITGWKEFSKFLILCQFIDKLDIDTRNKFRNFVRKIAIKEINYYREE